MDAETQAVIDKMQAEIVRLSTNPKNLPTKIQCNVCGETVDADKRCVRHPNDRLNHTRQGLPGEAEIVLVKQI